jgi:glycosyltransferase involved in cell wall biosynthesis
MVERAARCADAMIVPTRAVEAALREHLELPTVTVIGEGVSQRAARLPSDAAERSARLQVPRSGYLLSLATIEPRKGLDVLLDALVDPAAPDLPLLVVGQAGWGGIDVLQAAADRGLPAGRVRLLGRLPDEDLAVLLAGATALVVPSRAEGFGLPVVEAMSAGTAVVTSDDPALVEVGAGATRTAPIGDAAALARVLAEVAGDPALRREMVSLGRRRATDFSWDEAATQLVALYERLGAG